MMTSSELFAATLLAVTGLAMAGKAEAAPCMVVTLTGTQSGPPAFNGLAGSGTLVRYGEDANDCSDVLLQFDAGRGTVMRLSQVGAQPMDLDAVFITHIHSDHVEGFSDIAQMRWFFGSQGPKLDVVCSADASTPPTSPNQFVLSCDKFVRHINDAYHEGGTNAQQATELEGVDPAGPVPLLNIVTFEPAEDPEVVWKSGDVTVSAIRSFHIPGHASYRVDTPAGSVVIGGDASNDAPAPPRSSSTSEQVEKLAQGTDIIVHSAVHPDLDPANGSGFPPVAYYRQSNATDLGAMAQRASARYLMLTHLGPALGATTQGPFLLPGGAMTEARYRDAALAGGFTGEIVVGEDLSSVRLPAK